MSRKSNFKFLGFALIAVIFAYIVFMGYIFAVAQTTAKINQTDPQAEFISLMEQEQQSVLNHYQFFWPAWPIEVEDLTAAATPAPTATTTPTPVTPTIEKIYPTPTLGATSTQDSYGFFRNCTPDPIIPNHCICEDFNYTVHIERDNCQEDMCPATITFTNDYGDTMWVDFFDTMTSVQIKNGDSILLPSLNETNWSISSAIPFFEE